MNSAYGQSIRAEDLNRGPLVQHAIAKCQDCGSTLVTDPLPHQCAPFYVNHGKEEKCSL